MRSSPSSENLVALSLARSGMLATPHELPLKAWMNLAGCRCPGPVRNSLPHGHAKFAHR